MSGPTEQYKEAGIWTMNSPRETCVVPEFPLMISEAEERELTALALSSWNALENVVDVSRDATSGAARAMAGRALAYPEGFTMPPAVRIDTIITASGPKIVEIDPVSAISIGETLSLMDIWQREGYRTPNGLLERIALEAAGGLAMTIPSEKRLYEAELAYLRDSLIQVGVEMGDSGRELSSFSDVPAISRRINGAGWNGARNPLWGSLSEFSFKDNLDLLQSGDKLSFPRFLPKQFNQAELAELEPDTLVVAKPRKGTGSMGVRAIRAVEASAQPSGTIFQELLTPRIDNFGLERPYVSRVSLYAGAKGILGTQVTARPLSPLSSFTNVHGQADAIQTTLAITYNDDRSTL